MNPQFRYRIVSDSMDPLLKVGDEVVWEKIEQPFEELKRFDLLLFQQNQNLYCHFLWQVKPKHKIFVTRSYRYLWHEDLPLTQEKIIGRVTNHHFSFWQKIRVILFFLKRGHS